MLKFFLNRNGIVSFRILFFTTLLVVSACDEMGGHTLSPTGELKKPIPVAVLGDSDSHSYRDTYDNKARGGDYHHVTYNWPALWEMFRSEEVELGELGVWGSSGSIAKLKSWIGLSGRIPKKLDFKYNFSFSGARCESLAESWPYETNWLLEEIEARPEYWRDGLIIIRIGVNDIGQKEHLDRWAQEGLSDEGKLVIEKCIHHIKSTVRQISAVAGSIKIAIVGVCRDYNITETFHYWPEQVQIENIDSVLDYFDRTLKVSMDEYKSVKVLNDYSWLSDLFGDRKNRDLSRVAVMNGLTITNDRGDSPTHLILNDNHAGTIYNAHWLNHIIGQLNEHFDLGLNPLQDHEIRSVVIPGIVENEGVLN